MVEAIAVEVISKQVEVIDLRSNARQFSSLDVQAFVEAEDRKKVAGVDRYHLQPSAELAIYSIPPGPGELKAILEQVKPQKVYLIAQTPPVEKADAILTRLAGMAKFVIAKKGGEATIAELAAGIGQREVSVRIGLEWLAAGGHVAITEENEAVFLSAGSGEGNPYLRKELYTAIKGLLEETAAYRFYVATTKDPTSLFET
jgi:hypothetical protein